MSVHSEITFIALIVVVALLCGMAMLRLKLPALVGYILAGVVLGPSGFGLLEDRDRINLLAELGVLMLLFLIGLELSLKAFKKVWRIALFGTLLQVGGAIVVMLLLSLVFGWSVEIAMLLGFVIALSSTAVVIKMLADIGELDSEVGRVTIAILIAQDLAVVPMMLILNGMASEGGFEASDLLPIACAVGFLVLFVRFLGRRDPVRLPCGRWIVGDHDLTPLAALAPCFAAAAISRARVISNFRTPSTAFSRSPNFPGMTNHSRFRWKFRASKTPWNRSIFPPKTSKAKGKNWRAPALRSPNSPGSTAPRSAFCLCWSIKPATLSRRWVSRTRCSWR